MKASQERLRKAKPWLFQNHNPPKDTQLRLTHTQPVHQAANLPAAIASAPFTQAHTSVEAQPSSSSDPADAQPEQSGALADAQPSTSSNQMIVHSTNPVTATRDADRVVQRPALPTDGYGTTGQESQTLLSWPHTNKSALYYDSSQRDVVPFTESELADMVQGPPKQIKHSATRFPSDFDASLQSSTVIRSPSQSLFGKLSVFCCQPANNGCMCSSSCVDV